MISPSPPSGPLPIHLRSLAIFVRATARLLLADEANKDLSWELIAWNKSLEGLKLSPVFLLISSHALIPTSGCVLTPVPTAVPPIASSWISSSAF